jgi:hypothetical protein
MNHLAIGLLCSLALCATVAAQELSVGSNIAPTPTRLPVPRLVTAKLSVSGVQDKLMLMLPAYRANMPARLWPTLFDLALAEVQFFGLPDKRIFAGTSDAIVKRAKQ